MTALTRGSSHMPMKFSARRSSSWRAKRRRLSISGSRSTLKPARSRARTPRQSQPAFGEYEGATTPIVSPLTMAGGLRRGDRTVASATVSRIAVIRLSYVPPSRLTTIVTAALGAVGIAVAEGHVCRAGRERAIYLFPKGFRPQGRSLGRACHRLRRTDRRFPAQQRLHPDGR